MKLTLLDPHTTAVLVAERQRRLLAEVNQARQADQLAPTGLVVTVLRPVMAVWDGAATAVSRLRLWGTAGRQPRLGTPVVSQRRGNQLRERRIAIERKTIMDREQFDMLVRALAGNATRRRFGTMLMGFVASAGLPLASGSNAGAKKRRRKKRCKPDCKGKECGPDGCGKSCGKCGSGFVCVQPDGTCHSLCGQCPAPLVCDDTGQCVDPAS